MIKTDKEETPNIKKQGWKAEEIAEEATNKESDETVRQILRGDETKGDPDERDIAGSPDVEDTPHGSQERKHEVEKNK